MLIGQSIDKNNLAAGNLHHYSRISKQQTSRHASTWFSIEIYYKSTKYVARKLWCYIFGGNLVFLWQAFSLTGYIKFIISSPTTTVFNPVLYVGFPQILPSFPIFRALEQSESPRASCRRSEDFFCALLKTFCY